MSDLLKPTIDRVGLGLDALRRAMPPLALSRRRAGPARLASRYAQLVDIPIADATNEEIEGLRLRARGQFLARQEMWDSLGAEIRLNDKARRTTEGGTALADLLSLGARADVVRPVETALSDPGLMSAHAPRHGLAALNEIREDHADDYGIALVVVHAHIDIGWAWRGQGWISEVPEKHWEAFHRHFDQAGDILDGFDAFAENSPSLAAARCALLAAGPAPQSRVADDYEDLIDLDPANPRHMRALGNHLLPRWFGDYDQLELEARRTAARTADLWGAGGYAWVHFDAIAVDPLVLRRLDVPFFLEGLRDILARRGNQHMVNQVAAFCAVTLAQPRYAQAEIAETTRELRGALAWILRNHLREVHPLLWGLAAQGATSGVAPMARDALMVLGRETALARIATEFERDLRLGMRVVFCHQGVRIEPIEG